MLGFTARCAPDVVPRPVDGELAEARWFSRAQLRAAGTWASDEPVQSRIVRTPSPVSIAWHLISGWLEQD
jgi:NAD+ diphosphatase